MTLRAFIIPSPSDQIDNAPVQEVVDFSMQLLFQSLEQFPSQPRSGMNPEHAEANNGVDEQEPRTNKSVKCEIETVFDYLLTSAPLCQYYMSSFGPQDR